MCNFVEMEGKLQALTKGANWSGPTMEKENLRINTDPLKAQYSVIKIIKVRL